MKIVNFGSLNIDSVYRVSEIARPGETVSASDTAVYPGGKGLNQSVALARAGAAAVHAGAVGPDGAFLADLLRGEGVDISLLRQVNMPSGRAVIQVSDAGENAIVISGGANLAPDAETVASVAAALGGGDILLLQNETSMTAAVISAAAARGARVFFNPSPVTAAVSGYPLESVDTLLVNRGEYAALKDRLADFRGNLLITLGKDGAEYRASDGGRLTVPAVCAGETLDTTGAGDTFTGYFTAAVAEGMPAERALRFAAAAAAICVTRRGAAPSIPYRAEVLKFL